MDIEQRSATERDADAASLLIRRSFEALAADAWDASARAVFLTETSASALTSAIGTCACARSAFDGGHMVGFLLMKTPASLSLLFVHPSYLGRGIGRFVQKLEPSWKGSMLTDLERGKPIEIASLAGYVHRAGKLLGVATPFHRTAFRALCFHAQAR